MVDFSFSFQEYNRTEVMRMKKRKALLILALPLVFSVLLSCSSNKNNSQSANPSNSSSGSEVITESYKQARIEFETLTGIQLPSYSDLVVDNNNYHEGDTAYILDITGGANLTYNTYLEFESFFRNLFGNPSEINPTGSESVDRYAKWDTAGNRWYSVKWNSGNKTIRLSTDLIEIPPVITETYALAKTQFYKVTGVELPGIYDVFADEQYINSYEEGQDEYTISLISGRNLSYSTFTFLENFFKSRFGDCYEGYPIGSETDEQGQTDKWITDTRVYELKYNPNHTISIFTKSYQPQMTESYKNARLLFYSYTSMWLPEVLEVELLPASVIDKDHKIMDIQIPANEERYENFAYVLDSELSAYRTKDFLHDMAWLYDFDLNNQKHQANIELQLLDFDHLSIQVVSKDYCNISLESSEYGTAVITYKGEEHGMQITNVLEGETLTLTATANDDYEFKGWYDENQLLSASNPYNYAVSKTAVIEPRYQLIQDNMDETYRNARRDFHTLTNIYLPRYEGLIVDYVEIGEDAESYDIDIIGGSNLSAQTFTDFKAFFNSELAGWNIEDSTETTITYRSKYNESVSLIWQGGVLYLSASYPHEFTVDSYDAGKSFIEEFYGIVLPEYESVTIEEARFARDQSSASFIFNKESFTKDNYFAIKTILTEALVAPSTVDEADESHYETTWDYSEINYVLSWSISTKTISLVISKNM